MDLPRIASQTSICPQNIQLLTDFRPRTHRTLFSKRLQAAAASSNAATKSLPSKTGNGAGAVAGQPTPSITITVNDSVVGNGGASGGGKLEPQFPQLSSSSYQPSRRLEAARAMANLRKRVSPELLIHPHQLRIQQQQEREREREQQQQQQQLIGDVIANGTMNGTAAIGIVVQTTAEDQRALDNRPYLLQKILSNRPVSMVLDIADLQTAWQDSDFISDCLCWHNVYRERHCSPLLTMSDEFCHLAQTWANHLAHTNRFYYRRDRDIGQNLFCRPANFLQNDVTGQEVSTYWYNAVRQYDYGKEPDVLHANVNAGSFTQVVWANSRHFGVGMATSRSGKIVVVAHYAPAGNITGQFQTNVLPPVLEVPTIPPPAAFQASNDSSGTEDSRSNTTSRS